MIAALFLLAAEAPPVAGWNCKAPQVQQEMNWCAHQDFLEADAALNAQWKKTAAEMKRRDADWGQPDDGSKGYLAILLDAQRAWLNYRDAHCTSEGYLFRGGTMEPLIHASCKARLTEERTKQLNDLVEQ